MYIAVRAFCVLSFICFSGMAHAAPVGEIVSLQGKATLKRENAESQLKLMDTVEANDTIATEKDGIAVIQFKDLSTMTVGSQSEVTIDRYVYNPEVKDGNVSALKASSGFFHFVSGKLAKDKVKIETPVSTIGIRGTELAGGVAYNGETTVSLVECCVDVSTEAGTVSLDRVGTFTEISSRRKAPSEPDFTPSFWAQKAAQALGTTPEELGVPVPQSDYKIPAELGDDNRVSYPYIED